MRSVRHPLCQLFSSCLPVDRSDPAEDQELHWAQERLTLHQQSSDKHKEGETKFYTVGDKKPSKPPACELLRIVSQHLGK